MNRWLSIVNEVFWKTTQKSKNNKEATDCEEDQKVKHQQGDSQLNFLKGIPKEAESEDWTGVKDKDLKVALEGEK